MTGSGRKDSSGREATTAGKEVSTSPSEAKEAMATSLLMERKEATKRAIKVVITKPNLANLILFLPFVRMLSCAVKC